MLFFLFKLLLYNMQRIAVLGLDPTEYQFWNSKKYIINFNSYLTGDHVLGSSPETSYQHPLLDRLYLYKMQGINCGTQKIVSNHPVWIKSRFANKKIDSFKPKNKDVGVSQGSIWVDHLNGMHRSVGFILEKDEVVWTQVSYLYKDEESRTLKVRVTNDKFGEEFIKKYFPYQSGALTLDFIGEKVIDVKCFLRCELFNLYGLENFADFLITNHFRFEETNNWPKKKISEPCYSWHYYINDKIKVDNIDVNGSYEIKSIQKFEKEEKIAIINTQGTADRPKITIKGSKILPV